MVVNGATVDDALIPALARVVGSPSLAHKLQSAHRFRTGVVNLSSAERTLVLAALDGRSPALVELRAQLVAHPAWRHPTRIS